MFAQVRALLFGAPNLGDAIISTPEIRPKIDPPLSEIRSYKEMKVPSGPQTQNYIAEWYERGAHPEVTHLVVRRDQIAQVDYPYFSTAGADIETELTAINGENACDIIAVYNYRESLSAQITRRTRLNY